VLTRRVRPGAAMSADGATSAASGSPRWRAGRGRRARRRALRRGSTGRQPPTSGAAGPACTGALLRRQRLRRARVPQSSCATGRAPGAPTAEARPPAAQVADALHVHTRCCAARGSFRVLEHADVSFLCSTPCYSAALHLYVYRPVRRGTPFLGREATANEDHSQQASGYAWRLRGVYTELSLSLSTRRVQHSCTVPLASPALMVRVSRTLALAKSSSSGGHSQVLSACPCAENLR